MASIHFGRLSGQGGFSRLVAIKRLHPHFAKDPEFVKMFMDEARVASRIQHPNVVGVVDVVREGDEILLVMDYVHGESLSKLITRVRKEGRKVPCAIACAVVAQVLHGLHAAHEALGESGKRLEIVHRDVSPQNVMIGVDGIARVVDFGIAKALGRAQNTVEGQLKGKLGYFSPEQLQQKVDRRTDVFAAAVVLWEALRAERLFKGDTHWEIAQAVMSGAIPNPSDEDPEVPKEVGDVVLRGLSRDPDARFPTARAMAQALETSARLATASEVAAWVERVAGADLERRRARLAATDDLADVAPPPSTRVGEESRTVLATPRALASVESAGVKAGTPVSVDGRAGPRQSVGVPVVVTGVLVGLAGVAFGSWMLAKSQYERALQTAPPSEPPQARSAWSDAHVDPPAPVSTPATPDSVLTAPASGAPPIPSPAPVPAVARRKCAVDTDCGPVERCFKGECRCGGTLCNGKCVNAKSDVLNCGGCGVTCDDPAPRCVFGACRGCDPSIGLFWCDEACVNLKHNPGHCGACGTRCRERCINGKCDP